MLVIKIILQMKYLKSLQLPRKILFPFYKDKNQGLESGYIFSIVKLECKVRSTSRDSAFTHRTIGNLGVALFPAGFLYRCCVPIPHFYLLLLQHLTSVTFFRRFLRATGPAHRAKSAQTSHVYKLAQGQIHCFDRDKTLRYN